MGLFKKVLKRFLEEDEHDDHDDHDEHGDEDDHGDEETDMLGVKILIMVLVLIAGMMVLIPFLPFLKNKVSKE